MALDEISLEKDSFNTTTVALQDAPLTEVDKKTAAVSADKIKPPTTSNGGSRTYSILDSLRNFFSTLADDAPQPAPAKASEKPPVAKAPEKPVPFIIPPSLDQLWAQRDLTKIFESLEAALHSPMGIVWKPAAKIGSLPPLLNPCPSLTSYARDLTLEAHEGKLQPFVGRQKEIELTAEILMRNQKSNPLLLGAPGVGKTAFPGGIAQAIVRDQEDLSPVFKGKRIFLLQWERLAAGTRRYSEDTLEKRLAKILAEAAANKDQVILFIDEIHAFLQNDKESMAILKPALADGTISCMTATTPWDYKRMLEADPALERRFPIVPFGEPSESDVLHILKACIARLEAHHGVRISDEAVRECIELSKRFIRSESFPDKAIDLLDQAASSMSLSRSTDAKVIHQDKQLALFLDRLLFMRESVEDPTIIDQKILEIRSRFSRSVTPDQIRQVVSRKINIPLQKLQEPEKILLNSLEAVIAEKIIGQKEAIELLSQAVRRGRLRLGNQERPAGVFLLLGSTGVGKTASALALAETLYGSSENVLRLDMSEYQQSHEISKLIGAPPGYLGHGVSGKLTEWLKKKPNSIVIFDEVEKAHPAVFDLLLQVFDAGRITDGNNLTVRCLDTIFIMTSNIGAQKILSKHGKIPEEELAKMVEQEVDNRFHPEFVNRIQETVIFHPLTPDQVLQIVRLQCKELKERVEKNTQCPNLTMEWDESLVSLLAKLSYNPTKGARELGRQITKLMENPLANRIVQDKIVAGDHILFTTENNTIQIKVNGKLST
jgi:ATP-dependent Clp protease ATP-binding subunit ClpC